jgi:hypothetical protein
VSCRRRDVSRNYDQPRSGISVVLRFSKSESYTGIFNDYDDSYTAIMEIVIARNVVRHAYYSTNTNTVVFDLTFWRACLAERPMARVTQRLWGNKSLIWVC